MYDDDGSLLIKASLPAEAGALFVKALDAAADAAFRERRVSAETSASAAKAAASAKSGVASKTAAASKTSGAASDHPTPGDTPTLRVRRADALARIAESFLAHGAEALASGERHHVVVHVDAQTLREGCAGRCEHEHGPSLAIETARRLGCDASVVAVVEDEDGEPLNVGRKTRTIPPSIRRALFARDKHGCRFPAARTSTMWTGTTSSTGRMAARLGFRTSCSCAAFIIGKYTREASTFRCSTTARCGLL
jgi:hypothetical protein